VIQPLRIIHRGVFVTLAFVLPVILAGGLRGRRSRQQFAASVAQLPASAQLLRKSSALWPQVAIDTTFYADSSHPGNLDVVFHPTKDLNEPDLLVYWSAISPSGDSLPADAQLIGHFVADKLLALPANASLGGYIVLFSLPHQSVFDTAKVEKLL